MQMARTAFDQSLETVVAEATERMKGTTLPAEFSFRVEGGYYGSGYPPRGVPAELTVTDTGWQNTEEKRGERTRDRQRGSDEVKSRPVR
jgi:hypothetical protein